MQLSSILDVRDHDPWAKVRRQELVRHAHKHGQTDISEDMPADMIRNLLKSRRVPPPSIPPRVLGGNARQGDTSPTSHEYTGQPARSPGQENVVEIDAAKLAELEYLARQKPAEKPFDQMNINELRNACKARNIKLSRRDRMPDMIGKLNGK